MKTQKELTAMDCTHAFANDDQDHVIDVIHPVTGLSWINGESFDQMKLRYPEIKIVNMREWFNAKGERQDSPVAWVEITADKFDEYLCCLPPISYGQGRFLVGEPSDHHASSGAPRYHACVSQDGKHYTSNRPLTVKEFKALERISVV